MTGGCSRAHAKPTPRDVNRPVNQHRTRPSRAVAGGLAAVMLVLTAGCTGDDEKPEESAPSPLPSRSVGVEPTLEAKPVPTEVTVAKVIGGKLKRQQRERLEKQVSRVVSAYFDDAFLAGEYPRSDFAGALATFSPGAVERAASDRALLTNAEVGTSTAAVVARTKTARLDVLVPRRLVAGLTARIRLVFVQERTDGADQRVTVAGRLLINRKKSGPWQIFGYDITRSSAPAAKGSDR